jgi:hypothetical protein
LESDKWGVSEGNLKWSEDQPDVVKGRELRLDGMRRIYNGSEL